MPDPSPSLLEDLLERCILALEAGDQRAVDAVYAEHPNAAPELRQRLDQLAALGILHGLQRPPAIPERLGEFRLLRQLGRGGMGIVYLAEQTPLQRQVALKLVHPEQLFFPGARERFRREVLAVARLQHAGIVPILTCGEADGVPYYAMELVQGASLAELLQELAGTAPGALDGQALRAALQRAMAKKHDLAPTSDAPVFHGAWTNVCCRMVLQAAEALQHAHEQGVLHRDVKPSNLLLTAAGAVRVIDFGLASAHGEQRITRSGSAFGSLPYMAPEQVRGLVAAIDVRTDVYALGVTLYELLTLTLPHGDGSGTTRERILAGVIEPPARRNAQVHPDLEAVCLLAMDLDPARRYQTAAAFADDLRAFLEHRSVRARRPPWTLRTMRWGRRHPGRAAAASVAFLALVPAPLVFGLQQSAAAARIQLALDEADEQRHAAEQNLEQALRAVDQLLFRTASSRLLEHPRTAKLRRSLFEDAIAFHERLLPNASPAANPRVRADRARTQVRLGRLHMELGDLPKACATLEDAAAVLDELLPQAREPERVRTELGLAHHRLAEVYGRMERVADQEAAERRALALFEQVRAAEPHNPVVADALHSCRLHLASALGRSRRFAEAHALLDALEVDTQAPPPAALSADLAESWRLNHALVADHRGVLLALAGETEQAMQSLLAGLQRLDALPAELQASHEAKIARIGMLERLGQLGLQRRQWDRAAGWLDAAAAALEAMAVEEPELPVWRSRLADVLGSRAANRRELRDGAGAEADHDRSIALLEQVLLEAPAEGHHRRRYAIAFAERAGTRFRLGQPDQALEDLERAEREFERVLETSPGDEVSKQNLAAALANHARTLARLQRVPEARQLAERAITLVRGRQGGEQERSLVELCGLAADLAMQDLDAEAGQRWMQEASERAEAWLQKRPDDPLRQSTASMIASNRGTMFLQMKKHAEAIATYEAALPTARAAASKSPFGKQVLTIVLMRLADVAVRDGNLPKAREWFAAALAETGVTTAQLQGQPTLLALFEHPQMQDLVPKTNAAGK